MQVLFPNPSWPINTYSPLSKHKLQSINAEPRLAADGDGDSGGGGNRGRLTWLLVLSVAAAVAGSSTQFGYNTGVINSPKQVSE